MKKINGIVYKDIKNINDVHLGFKVELKNNDTYIVIKYSQHDFRKVLINPFSNKIIEINEYNNDLTHKKDKNLDIQRVWGLAGLSDHRSLSDLLIGLSRPFLWKAKDYKENE